MKTVMGEEKRFKWITLQFDIVRIELLTRVKKSDWMSERLEELT